MQTLTILTLLSFFAVSDVLGTFYAVQCDDSGTTGGHGCNNVFTY